VTHYQELEAAEVDVDRDGDAVIAWAPVFEGRVLAVRWFAGRDPGPVHTLSAVEPVLEPAREISVYGVDVAVDDAADAVIVWVELREGRLFVAGRRWSRSSDPGPLRSLSDGEFFCCRTPKVEVDSDGDAVALWVQDDGQVDREVGRQWASGSRPGPLVYLSPEGMEALGPHSVAVSGNGNAVLAWTAAATDNWIFRLQTRSWGSDGNLGPTETLTDPERPAAVVGIGTDRRGGSVVAWESHEPGGPRILGAHGP
jgi:hypothetical protein